VQSRYHDFWRSHPTSLRPTIERSITSASSGVLGDRLEEIWFLCHKSERLASLIGRGNDDQHKRADYEQRSVRDVLGGEDRDEERFRAFVLEVQPRLHTAFIAAFGHERGRDATAEALAYAWEHWTSVELMINPTGYLYRVGQSKTGRRRLPVVLVRPFDNDPWVEPGLPAALASLSKRQRMAVLLVHGEGWTLREVGELLRVSVSTVQKHSDRGMASLRRALKVDVPEEHL
jgi:DNA-directed RNA polymerase specialized sigma24 family protein